METSRTQTRRPIRPYEKTHPDLTSAPALNLGDSIDTFFIFRNMTHKCVKIPETFSMAINVYMDINHRCMPHEHRDKNISNPTND